MRLITSGGRRPLTEGVPSRTRFAGVSALPLGAGPPRPLRPIPLGMPPLSPTPERPRPPKTSPASARSAPASTGAGSGCFSGAAVVTSGALASVVVAVTGDGDFLMTGQELATAVRHDLRVVVLVIDNGQYGTIRMHQIAAHPGRPIATSLANPDFAAFASAASLQPDFEQKCANAGDAAIASAATATPKRYAERVIRTMSPGNPATRRGRGQRGQRASQPARERLAPW